VRHSYCLALSLTQLVVCSLFPGCISSRAASPNPSSRGSSCGIDEEEPGLEQPPPKMRRGRDGLVCIFHAIFDLAFSNNRNRLLAPAAVNLARRQMHQPRARRRKSQEFVPACHDCLVMSSHDFEGLHLRRPYGCFKLCLMRKPRHY
jgi:hypothetical protein